MAGTLKRRKPPAPSSYCGELDKYQYDPSKIQKPEQRFENPDGTDILFDRDYFGNHRGLNALPGPFLGGMDAEKALW